MSDTTNEFDGEATNVVQAGSAGHVYTGASQHVGQGMAVQGDFTGGLNLTFGRDAENGPASRSGGPRPREGEGMSDLIAFLRARLDEEHQTAALISPGGYEPDTWHVEPDRRWWAQIVSKSRMLGEPPEAAVREDDEPVAVVQTGRNEHLHIATYDPARVLRQVEAMRAETRLHVPEPGQHPDFCGYDRHELPCPSLRNLAAIWSDHPDYRQEWAR